ncbi:hypothetical protein C2E21_2638 [Chlorella sorokiniana]|uniref:Coenzyme Q-binding protein COQ10 START domain-containing protein n=1 Tax=Chlorella sorokiniana TaxID=3076 RepID=A0A2P6TYN1_CHLSO|nr:hypothetical protein C2E21_2638 [Chlorella sorokiniana]|eukprot:PRW59177.1 hypothetical protein C2E21_2638 [Chlorella sorokiniana]
MATASLRTLQPACGGPAATAAARQRRRQLPPLQPRRARQLGVAHAASVELDMDVTSSVDIENIQYEDGCYTVQGCLLSTASADEVYRVLTDYEALPRVFHNVETSQVRHDEASGSKQLVQTCKWAFLMFSGTFVTELSVHEDPSQRQLTFSLIESAFMKEFVGSWQVQPAADGGLTEVRHRLSVRPSLAPPQKIGDITKKVFKKQVEGILEDLALELER